LLRQPDSTARCSSFSIAAFFLVLFITVDSILGIMLFHVWGQRLALFINQSTCFIWLCMSIAVFAITSHTRGARGQSCFRPSAPRGSLLIIGLLDGLALFFMSVAQPHTPGLAQTLLKLLSVPLVFALSSCTLGKRPSAVALGAAALVVGGAATSSLTKLFHRGHSSSPVVTYSWSVCLFALAMFFFAAKKVYEERTFRRNAELLPIVMVMWTLCIDLALSTSLYPLQVLPAFGGVNLTELPAVIRDGVLCTIGHGDECTPAHAGLFWSYSLVDFATYYLGLFIIQRFGASLKTILVAVALPLKQLLLCSPLVGAFAETFQWTDCLALVLVLAGYSIYHGCSPEGHAARLPQSLPSSPPVQSGSSQTRGSLTVDHEPLPPPINPFASASTSGGEGDSSVRADSSTAGITLCLEPSIPNSKSSHVSRGVVTSE
jgi:hypothetical protein